MIRSGHHQTNGGKWKEKKDCLRLTRKLLKIKFCSRSPVKGMSDWITPLCKTHWAILKMNKKGTQKNWPEVKEVDDDAQDLTSKVWYQLTTDVKKRRRKRIHQHWRLSRCINNLTQRQQLYRYFKRQIGKISREKTWSWRQKGNLKIETEFLLIAAQNNTIRINLIIAKINLCGDNDKSINHILSKCDKLSQKKYKTTHNWMAKGIHKELCKNLKFVPTNKWYIHKPESVLGNRTHIKPLRFWETNGSSNPSQNTRLVLINKKKRHCYLVDFAVRGDHGMIMNER